MQSYVNVIDCNMLAIDLSLDFVHITDRDTKLFSDIHSFFGPELHKWELYHNNFRSFFVTYDQNGIKDVYGSYYRYTYGTDIIYKIELT